MKNELKEKWENLGGLLLICIVLARLCTWYADTHYSTKFIFLLIYAFHMPTAFFLLGHANKDMIRQKNFGSVVSCILLCFVTGGLIFAVQSLLGRSASLSLVAGSGIHSYALALAICLLVTILTAPLDKRWVMCCAVTLACLAGYDENVGDYLALSRAIVLFPFFYAGCTIDSETLLKKTEKKTTRILAAVLLIVFAGVILAFGEHFYWLRPLLTARNSFSSLSTRYGAGWLVRLLYYPVTFALIFALIAATPRKSFPVLGKIGQNWAAVFSLSYCVLYLALDLFGLDGWIDGTGGVVFYAILLALSVLIAWVCARPSLNGLVSQTLNLERWRTAGSTTENNGYGIERLSRFIRTREALYLCAVSVFLTFTFFLYGPMLLFVSNAEDLWFSLSDVFITIIPMFLLLTALLFLVGMLLPPTGRDRYIRLVFGIALAVYIQGTYINIDYGVLDGSDIEWGKYTGYAVIDTCVWILCISLPFILPKLKWTQKNSNQIIAAAAAFFVVIQIPAMAMDLINYTPKQDKALTVTTDGMYELSEKENIVMILFDTMDERYFESFLNAHPDYAENLDGFVHYDNTLSSGARTIMAMPSIMTGVPFKRQTTYSEYIESIWTDETPFAAMAETGYDVRCYTESMFFGQKAIGYVHNLASARQRVNSYTLLGQKLYKLTAFRFAPHLMKSRFWMDTSEFSEVIAQEASTTRKTYIEDDAAFFRNYLANGGYSLTNAYSKAFRLYLLRGAHSPYKLTSDGLDNSKTTSLDEQVEGNFALLSAILKDLKEKGIYDSCTIIATADHGSAKTGNYQNATHQMFLYKAPGASGAMTVAHAPVSMFDMYTFFYQCAGRQAPENQYSADFLSLTESEIRERHTFVNATNSTSQPVVQEYLTTGVAGDYEKMRLVAEYEGETLTKDSPYQLGTILSFGGEATANAYAVDGFGINTGITTTWLNGPYAKMEIPIENLPQQGKLTAKFVIDGGGNFMETGVKAYVNGNLALDSQLTKANRSKGINFTFNIEDTFADGDNVLVIELVFDAISMDEMELPLLSRTEHMKFKSMVIEKS